MVDVLVVEDDPSVAEHIETVLFSLGHRSQRVASQAEAIDAIENKHFDLALVDLQIPAMPGRGGADIEFGVNLLKAIRERTSYQDLPVMIMTAHAADGFNLVGKLKHMGANEFISKPFQTKGWTLSRAVQKLLAEREKWQKARNANVSAPQRFSGGELHFGRSRVTLNSVTVLINSKAKLMRLILEELSDRNSLGQYVALSGPELADRLMNERGSNAIAGAIKSFRVHAAKAVHDRHGIEVGPSDVICSGGPGYRLNDWITVTFADREAAGASGDDQQPSPATTSTALAHSQGSAHKPITAASDSADASKPVILLSDIASISDATQSARRQWIVSQLRLQRKLRTPDIARELGCSLKTVRTDIDALRESGRIEFVGASKSGYYQLVT